MASPQAPSSRYLDTSGGVGSISNCYGQETADVSSIKLEKICCTPRHFEHAHKTHHQPHDTPRVAHDRVLDIAPSVGSLVVENTWVASSTIQHPAEVDHPPSKSRPLSSARHEEHTKESKSRVCAALDVLAGQLSTSGRLRVLQVARHVQGRVLHAGCHGRMFKAVLAPSRRRMSATWQEPSL